MAYVYVPYDGPVVTRADAQAAGLTRFYTGKACKHGHLSQRTTANGGCIACNAIACHAIYAAEGPEKRALRNARTKAWKDAHREQVRAEGRAYSKANRDRANAWKAANREEVNAAGRAYRQRKPEVHRGYYARNKERFRVYAQSYYLTNAEAVKQRVKAWREEHPGRLYEIRRAWYLVNADAVKRRVWDWCEANPEANRAIKQRRRARERGAEGTYEADDILRIGEAQGWKCHWCGKPAKRKYHVDHIVPLSKGGTNWPSNLAISCGPCNVRKGASDPFAFANRLGLLL